MDIELNHPLSVGCIEAIWNGDKPQHPTVQFVEIKKITSASNQDRYRLAISDSKHYLTGILATQLNSNVTENKITERSIVQLTDYVCIQVQGKKAIIVLGVQPLSVAQTKLGDPKPLQNNATTQHTPQTTIMNNNSDNNTTNPFAPTTQQTNAFGNTKNNQPNRPNTLGNTNLTRENMCPIKSLNPYRSRWVIKARVTAISKVYNWSNARGQGKVCSVDFVDETAEIRATMFQEAVDLFLPMFELDKIYYISRAPMRVARRKYSPIGTDYELTLNATSIVQLATDQSQNLPQRLFIFEDWQQLQLKEADSVIDIIGVVHDTEAVTLTRSNVERRIVTLVAPPHEAIQLTLWNDMAQNPGWEWSEHPVIALKHAKVVHMRHGGPNAQPAVALSTMANTGIHKEPGIDETPKLRHWYDEVGCRLDYPVYRSTPTATFADLKTLRHGTYLVTGTILHIKHDTPVWYNACFTNTCTKKRVEYDESSQTYFCPKCVQRFKVADLRYAVSFIAFDHTGKSWLCGFDDVGALLFGMDAYQMKHMQDSSPSGFDNVLKDSLYKTYSFMIKCSEYLAQNGETKTSLTLLYVLPVHYANESKKMIKLIKGYQ